MKLMIILVIHNKKIFLNINMMNVYIIILIFFVMYNLFIKTKIESFVFDNLDLKKLPNFGLSKKIIDSVKNPNKVFDMSKTSFKPTIFKHKVKYVNKNPVSYNTSENYLDDMISTKTNDITDNNYILPNLNFASKFYKEYTTFIDILKKIVKNENKKIKNINFKKITNYIKSDYKKIINKIENYVLQKINNFYTKDKFEIKKITITRIDKKDKNFRFYLQMYGSINNNYMNVFLSIIDVYNNTIIIKDLNFLGLITGDKILLKTPQNIISKQYKLINSHLFMYVKKNDIKKSLKNFQKNLPELMTR